MAGKILFFIEDLVATEAEKRRIAELTELTRNYATVLVRTKDANTLYGERLEDAVAVYNPPAEYAAAPTMTDSDAASGVLIAAADKSQLAVGETTRLHVAYGIGGALAFVGDDMRGVPRLNFLLTDDADRTGTKIEVVTGGATPSSSDTAVATVAADGLITGVATGTATITATYNGRSATFAVQVA